MKKIITTVGTSLFENYCKEEEDDHTVANYLEDEDIKYKSAEEYGEETSKIEKIEVIKSQINNWINERSTKENISAEVKSLIKLKEKFKEDFEIYLLYSDTVISKLAGEVLKEVLSQLEKFKNSKIYLDIVKDLQVWDNNKFKNGMVNLINKTYQIADGYFQNIIFNITGGYKATVPYLTILAQVNRVPIYYIFEETDALMEIPYIPLDINWKIFEENKDFFEKLEKEDVIEFPKEISYKEEISSLIEIAEDTNSVLISLNPLGVALWERYKQFYDVFYISDIAKKYIEERKNYRNIAEKTFLELKRRLKQNPNDPDLHHRVKHVNLPKKFACFKHKEDNLQVRVLYTVKEWTTRYNSKTLDIYIGLISIGSDVHNVESEYVDYFRRHSQKITNLNEYTVYTIEKEEYR